MKKSILNLPLMLVASLLLMLSACKKDTTTTGTTEDDSVSAQDAATISSAVNATANDATAAAGQVQSFSGKTDGGGWWEALCGASTVDTSIIGQITITYDGTTHCFGIIRSGSVIITLTNGPWKNQGAALSVTLNNLKITDVVTGANYTLNGMHTVTNETGKLAWRIAYGLLTNDSVIHRDVATNMSVTFADSSQRTWSVDRSTEWSSSVSGIHNTITATYYTQATGNIDMYGTNRYGTAFTNTISVPVAADNNLTCPYKPYQGEITHQIANRKTTVVYGTDASGNPIGTPTVCGLGYFITYTKNGHTLTKFVGYWQ